MVIEATITVVVRSSSLSMNKILYATIPLHCSINEFQDILEFTYGGIIESTTELNKEEKAIVKETHIYKYKFYVWDKIEIIYNIKDKLVKIYKCLESNNTKGEEKDNKNKKGEEDTEKMIDLVIESMILSIISMDQADKGYDDTVVREEEEEEYERLEFKDIDPIITLFKEQFGTSFSSVEGIPNNGLITLDRINAQVDFNKMKVVKCNSNPLRGRIESLLSIGRDLKQPLC